MSFLFVIRPVGVVSHFSIDNQNASLWNGHE